MFDVLPIDNDSVAVQVHALVQCGICVGVEEVGGALGGTSLTRRIIDAPLSWLTHCLLASDQESLDSRGGRRGLQRRSPPRLAALLRRDSRTFGP